MIRATRERALLAVLAVLTIALVLAALDASRRSLRQERVAMGAITEATGLSDLALSSSSRWLRHPSLAEPGAALWDAPLGLDTDPAGASIRGGAR